MKNNKDLFWLIIVTTFLIKVIFDISFFHKNSFPWVSCLDDEYLYLNRARNMALGNQNIADEDYPSTYPPIAYSLLILPGFIKNDPIASYHQSQNISIIVSNLLIFVSIALIATKLKMYKNKKSLTLLFLLSITISSISSLTGYYNTIMSENLFIPLVLLPYAILFHYEDKKTSFNKKIIISILITIIVFLSTYVRDAGLFSLISIVPSTLLFLSNRKKKILVPLLSLTLVLIVFYYLPHSIVNKYYLFDEITSSNYKTAASGISQRLIKFFTFQYSFESISILLKNHFSYLLISTFIFPMIFFLRDIYLSFKNKKLTPSFVFLVSVVLITFSYQFIHNVDGYYKAPLIRSLYSRYLDPISLCLFVYGIFKLIQYLKLKTTFSSKYVTISISVFSILFIGFIVEYSSELFIGLNNFGMSNIKSLSDSLLTIIFITTFSYLLYKLFNTKNYKILVSILVSIIFINLLTYKVSSKAIKEDGLSYQKIVSMLNSLDLQNNHFNFYHLKEPLEFDKQYDSIRFVKKVYNYFLKWYLAYYLSDLQVIKKVESYDEINFNQPNILLITTNEYQINPNKFKKTYQFHPNYILAETVIYEN